MFRVFRDCPGILTIELQHNSLDNVDGPFLISKSLQYLDVSYSNLSMLSMEFFANITALHTLDLSGNPLITLDQGIFDPLTSLETLTLNNCKLTHISDNTFFSLEALKRLELSGNYLTEIDWTLVLGTLYRLDHLDLRNSGITVLPEDTFMNSTWLRTLILAENDLTDLDVALTLGNNLRHLDTLDLSNCHLKGLLSEDAFANATKLKTLHLSGNPLFAFDLQVALEPLSNLERLFLSNCGLKYLPKSFEKLKQLEELDISHNPLNDAFIKIIAPLEKLKYLNMGYSNLSHIGPKTFSKMTSMKHLVLSGNDLNSLEAGLFGNLTHLESLELNYCGLSKSLNATIFFNNLTYTELKELKLAGNPLVITRESPLLPRQLSRIQHLDLSNCNLSYLPDNAFKRNGNITHLNLSNNKFNSQPGSLKFLQLLPKLENLDLGNNNLTSLMPHILVKNPRITSLRLVGNPWRCDCAIAEMWDWASMVKGDLSILVGSKTSPDDFTLKGAKKKKSLICYYDMAELRDNPISNRSVAGRRPFVKPQKETNSPYRTWAKYVRESGCEPVVRILQPQTLTGTDELEQEEDLLYPHVWLVVVFAATLIVLTSMAIFLLSRKRARHFKISDSSNKLQYKE